MAETGWEKLVSEKLAQSFGYRFRDGQMVTVDRPLFEGF
jgi:hypothetical protein